MATTTKGKKPAGRAARWRPFLLAFVALRAVLSIIAVPLAPWLYREHLGVLVLLRPTKEVLLLAGYEVREEAANPIVLVFAALPILVLSVWVFYALGKAYESELEDSDLPGIAGRLLPRERIEHLREAIGERGWSIVFLGRLAIMPSTLVAAAAGSADMPTRTFLLADGAGAVTSLATVVGAGYVLGKAYEDAGPWLSAVGALVLLGLLVLLGRKLRGTKT